MPPRPCVPRGPGPLARRFLIALLTTLLGAVTSSAADTPFPILPVPGTWNVPPASPPPAAQPATPTPATKPAPVTVGWYRAMVRPPIDWNGKPARLWIDPATSTHEVFVNGRRIGGGRTGQTQTQPTAAGPTDADGYPIPSADLRAAQWNLVAIRLQDPVGNGGFHGKAPILRQGSRAIHMAGPWEFRAGDQPAWAQPAEDDQPRNALYHDERSWTDAFARAAQTPSLDTHRPLPPDESLRRFIVPDDLEIELLLAEPDIAQPLALSFDERGRLWVVEYRQYPAPAGLKLVSHDQFWRAVYDRVPEPPPRGVRGKDRISIHEDTDGDGRYDRHKVFVDGLNIATAAAKGRGGVWVLNPPYLLFYADRNNDDVPDGDPEVHLSGFGLEDTHSVINSLRWAPDGWLYAAQGSTVSAHVVRPGDTNAPVDSMGQQVWRYHPEQRRYEVFSEGGGNAFGLEIDDAGRIFSGHNGGDTRGFHYHQGAYLQKGFQKHGELSNPHAFGYFSAMPHHSVERFTHTFLIYAGAALPARYHGLLFGVEPLQGRVVLSRIEPDQSSFRTKDIGYAVETTDRWFKPVDIKAGPDGALYIADWYDYQVNHWRNYQGDMDASNGRVYRLKSRSQPLTPISFAGTRPAEWIRRLDHTNRWVRHAALQLLADSPQPSLREHLGFELFNRTDDRALDLLWALNACAGLDEPTALRALHHTHAQVRLWTARLLGDSGRVSQPLATRLAHMAAQDPSLEVRNQLASTARRLPPPHALPILQALAARDEDARDPRQPLLAWWTLETLLTRDPENALALFKEPAFWDRPLVREHLLERTMRRFAVSDRAADLDRCASLLELAPSRAASEKLMKGFEAAFDGRSMAGLPDRLIQATARHGVGSAAFDLRLGKPGAVENAIRAITDPATARPERIRFIQLLGEIRATNAVPALLQVAAGDAPDPTRQSALTALQPFADRQIPTAVVQLLPKLGPGSRQAALTLLAGRPASALQLVGAVRDRRWPAANVPREIVEQMRAHNDARLQQDIDALWPKPDPATETEIQSVRALVESGTGNPYDGKTLFDSLCAVCHRLFNQGTELGPDLTSFQRQNLDHLILSIVNPTAEIREGYTGYNIETVDDRSLSGTLVEQNAARVILRGLDGQNHPIERTLIRSLQPATRSLMPEGLLQSLEPDQIRHLFAYLRSSQPLSR